MNRIKEKWRNLEKKTGTQIASAPFFIADFLRGSKYTDQRES
ncbi:hypothetical protein COPCOM_02922 [Coprococcus comes ATCC 27758]|uniref:Uncharacterized protein n=1 Tax=Coprococcus comes ATCC 27758 TaxID=470146 RepID=C0BCN1_9FIRM|nr:hypothetical protein COPCOM_02922 [Coprococcus comes ATCC 27758]